LLIIAALGFAAAGNGQRKELALPSGYPYGAAFISTISAAPGHTDLVVFPVSGSAFKIPIRSARGGFRYSPDGTALYGACTPHPDPVRADEPPKVALCKIDLNTTTTTPVLETTGLHAYGFAISRREDRILFSGIDPQDRDVHGLFELSLPGGKSRTILRQADKRPQSSWMDISLSPDDERAVATHNGRLELIDIIHGTVEPLGEELSMAAWSPDGKWLAAVEKGEHGRTILMDAKNLKQRRILGPSELEWSPDSHYLLGMKQHDRCGPYYGTIEAIDIENGERITIKSSECQVNQANTGWVSIDILRKVEPSQK
jgi:WD40 repeat protein